MIKRKIIVIGGGPAGLMAAGQAAKIGADTLVIEKMNRPGKKLCITGKGRCNITNIKELSEFIEHLGKNGRFLRQAFSNYFSTELMDFFQNQGLELVTERGGRVFPASGKAIDVYKTLMDWIKRCGVQIKPSSQVEKLIIRNGGMEAVLCKGNKITCDAVIIATGGASYPATGSTGDGYKLAKAVGHQIVSIRPALVPLEIADKAAATILSGLKLKNINVSMYINAKKRKELFGEMEFTDFGASGPVVLTLSGEIVDKLRSKNKIELSIDLKPALDEKKLDARIIRDQSTRIAENFGSFLRGFIPNQLIPICLKKTQIPADRLVNQIKKKERKDLRTWLKDFRLEITGYRSFSEAIITAGGVNTKEINPRTMESKIIKNLYFAGEILDINGDTGGYNLQVAFSTGWLAGRSAAGTVTS